MLSVTNTMPLLPSEGQELMSRGQKVQQWSKEYSLMLHRKGTSMVNRLDSREKGI